MFLPIGDTPNPAGFRAWINWLLIAINVGIFVLVSLPLGLLPADPHDPLFREYLRLLSENLPPGVPVEAAISQISAYDLLVLEYGYKPGAPQTTDLFAAMFLHGGLLHLAGNMLFLWIYGDNVEHRLGRLGYLLTYLLTGIAATLGFAALAGDTMTPMVGASGAVSGVLGLYFLLFPRNRVKVLVLLFPFFINVWLVRSRIVLGFYLVLDNVLPLLGGFSTGVAYGAHIGGFLAGLAIAFVGEHLAWRWPWRDSYRELAREAPPAEGAPLEALRDDLARGDRRQAIGHLGQLKTGDFAALSTAEVLRLARWLGEQSRAVAGLRLLRNALDRTRDSADRGRLHLAMAELQLVLREPVLAYQHLVAALEHRPDPQTTAEAHRLLRDIGVDPGSIA